MPFIIHIHLFKLLSLVRALITLLYSAHCIFLALWVLLFEQHCSENTKHHNAVKSLPNYPPVEERDGEVNDKVDQQLAPHQLPQTALPPLQREVMLVFIARKFHPLEL